MSSNTKDVKDLVRKAKKRGWCVTITGGTHLRWQLGEIVFHSASTPSDYRAIRKIKKCLRDGEAGKKVTG